MRGKSIYIVLIIILFVFFIVMFVLFGLDNIRKKNLETTIITGDNTAWVYKNAEWYNVLENDFSKLNWQEYKVFSDNKYLGKYLLWHDDKWYVFDHNKKAIDTDGVLMAYRANYNIKVAEIADTIVDDDVYVTTALDDNNISLDTDFTSKYKVSIDYDNDGIEEDFYIISNVFSLESENSIFSIVFMAKDDKIYYIYRDVDSKKGLNGCKPFFKSFLDVDQDDKFEFILGCGRYSIGDEVNMLYKEDNGDFKILISN